MTSKILRNCCDIMSRNVSLEVNSIRSWLPCLHVHPIHYCLSLNLRNLMNHLSCLLHFRHHYTGNLLIATAHIEPKDTRLHFWWTKQDIVSYPLPEQQSTQVDYVIWYPCSVISKTKNHSRRSKYLPYVCCLPSRYSTYLIAWSCWEVTLASLGKKLYHITYWGFVSVRQVNPLHLNTPKKYSTPYMQMKVCKIHTS